MSLYLALDTETSGLPSDGKQPWPVSIAAELFDDRGEALDFFHTRIRAEIGSFIDPEATAIHGITSRDAARKGVSAITALGMLVGLAAQASFLIGHNIDFDRDVVVAALAKLNRDPQMLVRPGIQLICTMKTATPLCRIPSEHPNGGFQYPSLDRLLAFLNLAPRPTPHNAWSDMQSAKACFLALRERKVLEAA